MKVEKFVHDYRIANKIKDGGINFIKEHMTNAYIPYLEKMTRCQLLVNSCWYRTDPVTNIKRLVINSPNLYVMFTMELVSEYTDINPQWEGTKIVEDYDALRKSGILAQILALIPKSEFSEYNSVLNMIKDDVIKNEYEVGAYIRNRFSDGVAIVGQLIMPALEKAGVSMSDITTLLSSTELKNYIASLKENK